MKQNIMENKWIKKHLNLISEVNDFIEGFKKMNVKSKTNI